MEPSDTLEPVYYMRCKNALVTMGCLFFLEEIVNFKWNGEHIFAPPPITYHNIVSIITVTACHYRIITLAVLPINYDSVPDLDWLVSTKRRGKIKEGGKKKSYDGSEVVGADRIGSGTPVTEVTGAQPNSLVYKTGLL